MLKGIVNISNLLGADLFWVLLVIALLLLLGIVRCLYPWQPKGKSKKTIDKNGNEVVVYYQIK